MTLDEAIKHCEEKAKELSDKAYAEWGKSMTEEEAYDCNECAREHEQLAEWLKDYKRLLEEQRPKGEWIECEEWDETYYECSVCKEPWCTLNGTPADNLMNYCPVCGARMEGVRKNEDN